MKNSKQPGVSKARVGTARPTPPAPGRNPAPAAADEQGGAAAKKNKAHDHLAALILEEHNLDLEVQSLRRTADHLAALLAKTEDDAMKAFAKWQKVNARVLKKLGRTL